MKEYYQQSFGQKDFTSNEAGEYEDCSFNQLDLSSKDLSNYKFIDCSFDECNLSNAKLINTSFQECKFKNCKLLGLQFEDGNHFNFLIHCLDSQLDHATFYQLNLSNSVFEKCSMQGVDLTEADLSNGKLVNCDLMNAQFERTDLEGCDLSESYHFQIDPEVNNISRAQFSQNQLIGLLSKYNLQIKP